MITKTLVFNDPHIPFHDPRSLRAMFTFAHEQQVNRIVINGDLLDFYNVHMHGPKHPDVATNLESEINAGREFLVELRKAFPNTEIIFIFGNHEDRMDRFIIKNAKAFWNIFKLERMLMLEELNIKFQYYNTKYQLEQTNLFIQHSPPSYGKNGAMTSLETKLDCNFIYGCSHRVQMASRTGSSGEVYRVWFNGWLGSTTLTEEHARVFSYAKQHENWQQAFCLVTVEDGTWFDVDQISIVKNKFAYNGKIYKG